MIYKKGFNTQTHSGFRIITCSLSAHLDLHCTEMTDPGSVKRDTNVQHVRKVKGDVITHLKKVEREDFMSCKWVERRVAC